MAELEQNATANPGDCDALNALGLRYLQDAKTKLAGHAFRRSLQIAPADALAGVALGCVLAAENQPQSALDRLQACLADHPDYEPALVAADVLRRNLGDAGESAGEPHFLYAGRTGVHFAHAAF
jgi:Tfp pilus assembly protein PilF